MAGHALQRLKHSTSVAAPAVRDVAASALGRYDNVAAMHQPDIASPKRQAKADAYLNKVKLGGQAVRGIGAAGTLGVAGAVGLNLLNRGANDEYAAAAQSLMNQGYSEDEASLIAGSMLQKQERDRQMQAGGGAY